MYYHAFLKAVLSTLKLELSEITDHFCQVAVMAYSKITPQKLVCYPKSSTNEGRSGSLHTVVIEEHAGFQPEFYTNLLPGQLTFLTKNEDLPESKSSKKRHSL